MTHRLLPSLLVLLVLTGSAGCARFGGGTGGVDAERAVELALLQDDRFAGIGPRDDQLIGQASWYEVIAIDDGWRVLVRIGWGDCPSGCINERRWTYEVHRSGAVELVGEQGDSFPRSPGIRGVVVAGPTCPVESVSPDPSCADRAVSGAVLVVLDLDGEEVARVRSAADGSFWVDLAPGAYRVVPQPVEGMLGTAGQLEVRVDGDEPTSELTIAYDTGIR